MKKILTFLIAGNLAFGMNDKVIDNAKLRENISKISKDLYVDSYNLVSDKEYGDYTDNFFNINYDIGEVEKNKSKGVSFYKNITDEYIINVLFNSSKEEELKTQRYNIGLSNIDLDNLGDYSIKSFNLNYYSNKINKEETEDYLVNMFYQVGKILDVSDSSFFDTYMGLGFSYFSKGESENKKIKKDNVFLLSPFVGMNYTYKVRDFKFYVGAEYEYNYLDEDKNYKEFEKNHLSAVIGMDYIINSYLSLNLKHREYKLGKINGYNSSVGFTYLF